MSSSATEHSGGRASTGGMSNLIIPVFCTAEIPSSVLDSFIERTDQLSGDWSLVPLILDPEDVSNLAAVNYRSKKPMAGFASPFLNMTLSQVNEFFMHRISSLENFTSSLFIVLDQRTLKDETCFVIAGGDDFDEKNEECWLRTDFYMSLELANQAELGNTDLGENMDRDEVWGLHNISRP